MPPPSPIGPSFDNPPSPPFPSCPPHRSGNDIGDDGARALAGALQGHGLVALKEIYL